MIPSRENFISGLGDKFQTPSTSGAEQFLFLWTCVCLHHLPVGVFGNFWGWRRVVLEGNIPPRINFVPIWLSNTPEADAFASCVLTKVSPALMAKDKVPQQLPRGHLQQNY